MVKVALLAPDDLPVPPKAGGSVQIYLNHLVDKLAEQPHLQPVLISPGRSKLTSIKHYPIAARQAAYLRKALATLVKVKPDIVQIENRPAWVPLVKKVLPATKVVLNLHSVTFVGVRHIQAGKVPRILKQASAVTVNSDSLRRTLKRRFRLHDNDWNPVVVYPGVESARFRGKKERTYPEAFGPHRPLRLLFVGRVIQQKGVHLIIDAVRRLHRSGHPVSLTIIGKTPPWEQLYRQTLQKRAQGFPIRFLGFVSQEKLGRHYAEADVLVCPSQSHEAFGLVNVEAMASGLPVIASRQGGIREVVDDTCGWLVHNYQSASAFQKTILPILQNPHLLSEASAGALRRATRFTWNQTAASFAEVYQQIT